MTAPSLQVQFDPSSARFGASRSQKRIEDDRLLTGKGRYSDDLEFPRQCWLVLVRSPHAHAKITGIDLSVLLSLFNVGVLIWFARRLHEEAMSVPTAG